MIALLEIHLQQLWSDKRLPFHAFHLTNGSPIEIFQTGVWNKSGSGPDFQCAKMRFDDLTWYGSVEFHLKSSDWYKHQHQLDKAYENVILHVVFEHDHPVYINHYLLPTLELKSYLIGEFKFPLRYKWEIHSKIHCGNRISAFPIQFRQMQHRTIIERITRKYSLNSNLGKDIFGEYSIISTAFGTKNNCLSFELLTLQIPLQTHFTESEDKILERVLANDLGWKGKNLTLTKGLRARIFSWTKFIRWFYTQMEERGNEAPWKEGFVYANIKSKMLQNNLLINAKTYIDMHAYQRQNKTKSGIRSAMKHLESIPPEKNRISSIWKTVEIEAKNALESQANLEIYQQFCTRRKCLDCSVGQQISKI